MHPQLRRIADDYDRAREQMERLAAAVPPERWAQRPRGGGWSAAECVDHLNRTSEAFLPLVRAGLDEARALGAPAPARYRRDAMGWLLWKIMGPPVRVFRVKTSAGFRPAEHHDVAGLVRRWRDLHAEQLACVQAADGLPIDRVRIVSPFDPRARYNVYAALGILPLHQQRHLWQAERAVAVAG